MEPWFKLIFAGMLDVNGKDSEPSTNNKGQFHAAESIYHRRDFKTWSRFSFFLQFCFEKKTDHKGSYGLSPSGCWSNQDHCRFDISVISILNKLLRYNEENFN